MEVLIKRNIKKLQSFSNVFHFNVQIERNIAEKTAIVKKKITVLYFSLLPLKKMHNFKMVSHFNYSPRIDSKQYAFGFLLTSLKITLFYFAERFDLLY